MLQCLCSFQANEYKLHVIILSLLRASTISNPFVQLNGPTKPPTMSLWDDAGAIPPVLTAEKLAEYLRGNPGVINEIEPRSGLTPLAKALRSGNATTVQLLLNNGADPDKKTQDGRTPMYMAASASRQRARMIQLLLAKNPATFDEAGPDSVRNETPLMEAVRKGDAAAVKLLVEQGASKTKVNSNGQTARDIAGASGTPKPEIEKALNIVASKGSGGLMTYIKDWVIKVLAYFNIWRPLSDIFDAASRAFYGIPAPGPIPGNDIEEPQTAADFKNNLDNMVARGGLEKFFPPGNTYLQEVANQAVALKSDPNNLLNSPAQLDALAKLALYQPVLYCDDSGSMWDEEDGKGTGERWRAQIQLVKRMSEITTRAVPNKRGCHLRFINWETPDLNNLDDARIDHEITNYSGPWGSTPIGTMLRKHVLDPIIYKDLNSDTPFKLPFLILVSTDGYPTREKAMDGDPAGQEDEDHNEDPDRFRKEIRKCGDSLVQKGYRKDVVKFVISQIGKKISYEEDAQKVKKFLDGLEFDPEIQDVLYRTTDLMDARYEELRDNKKDMDVWVCACPYRYSSSYTLTSDSCLPHFYLPCRVCSIMSKAPVARIVI
ncbi:hypothetical protein F5Y19DRAFT_440392 [Xylariaceae sp. FL1651]|nr:hypothetical protein F5Y19DRAFT_440392 [Xylariaceae sp. FL1651]